MAGRVRQVQAKARFATNVQERAMSQHPTVVHWAADLHRQELLVEAATDRRTPGIVKSKSAFTRLTRAVILSIAAAASWFVGEFEPLPGPRPASAGRSPARLRT